MDVEWVVPDRAESLTTRPLMTRLPAVETVTERREGAALVAYETVPAGRIHSVNWPVISVMRSKSWS